MKNTVKRMSALLLAMTCIPLTNLKATAADLANPWWGSANWDAFADREPVNDRGMLTGTDGLLYIADGERFCYLLKPRKTHMEFVLRDNVDADAAGDTMVQILDTCFPGIKDAQTLDYFTRHHYCVDSVCFAQSGNKQFSLDCDELPENAKQIETKLLVEFAKRGLISEFYGWGGTAFYSNYFFEENVVESYAEERSIIHPEAAETGDYITTEPVDWDAVQEYLNETHPGYTVECYEVDREVHWVPHLNPCYRINGAEALTYREKIELAGELYEKFGIQPPNSSLCDPAESAFGHNALENPGDTNLDCEVDILDVIAANKHILGVGTLDKTGLKNADMDGNGTADSEDSLAILKKVLE